ncbi:ketoacyl-ACP synthase III family protein [Streptantibioticus rubrisoli]|uniref:Ketoacyl-ACP synthase III family protein n=1 Tax=Streptantibioticus rubrisoli TaxID=1387313 RepID=A0ABT1PGQ7_9ACTN|nr:ketoacyl-ACP synthase III family protein [Streptantibioticus rubrisoli]MCQ4044534.1 ketoacyl-ACP synthase III family protein [Streptantibioticus rubrisoli]
MRFDDLYVAGAAAHFPGRFAMADAVTGGLCDARIAERTGVVSVAFSEGESAPEMAVQAARTALDRSGAGPHDIDLILHATVYYQGHDLWAPASYIQREAVGNRCPAVEVRQLSNGGMAAVELAAGYLTAGDGTSSALLTTGDRFCGPGFDRWGSDPGTVYGDAGTALVLSRGGGFARVRSLVTVSEPELEGIHRGDDPFGPAPFSVRRPMDLEVLKRDFIGKVGISYGVARVSAGQSEALKGALAAAEAELSDIAVFVLPQFGLRRLTSAYLRPWGLDPAVTTWPWGRTVGHLGAGDQFAGLAHLVEERRVKPGDLCLMAGVGAGYTWTCCVLEIQDVPSWSV